MRAGTVDIGVIAYSDITLDRKGAVIAEKPLLQIVTSWDRLRQVLLKAIDRQRYHFGHVFERVEQDGSGVRVQFANRRSQRADLLVACEGFLAHLVPAVIEFALVLRDPVLRNMVRRMRRARREVNEERLVGCDRFLLPDPADRFVGHVLHQVVALVAGTWRLDRRRPLIQRRVVLAGLSANEPVEVLETQSRSASGRRGRSGVDSNTGTLWHLPNCAVEFRLDLSISEAARRYWAASSYIRAEVAISVMPPMPTAWWLRPVRHRRARRRTERGGVEAGVLQPFSSEPLGGRRLAWSSECAGRAEADVVEQDHQHVWCSLGGRSGVMGGNLVSGSLAS